MDTLYDKSINFDKLDFFSIEEHSFVFYVTFFYAYLSRRNVEGTLPVRLHEVRKDREVHSTFQPPQYTQHKKLCTINSCTAPPS